jgi:GNAT superfamily N-acetyltransferase
VQDAVIRVGGTTAYEEPKALADLVAEYLTFPPAISCMVALDGAAVLGFQTVGLWPSLPDGWGDIGTFVQPGLQARGIGQALFAASLAEVRRAGLATINATIRADNVPGLAYYARLGFRDYGLNPGFTLRDGRRVGQVLRRYDPGAA